MQKLFSIPTFVGIFIFIGVIWLHQAVQLPSLPRPPAVAATVARETYILKKQQRPIAPLFYKKTPSDATHTNPQPGSNLRITCVKDLTASSGVEFTIDNSDAVANGGEVTVRWRGVTPTSPSPYYSDWIGLFCPKDAPPNRYSNYWWVHHSPTYLYGFGEVDFNVYNLRVDCEFRYYSNGDICSHLLSRSEPVIFKGGPNQPTQGHIALTGDPTEMRVEWTSGTKATPFVKYGYSPSQLEYVAAGISRTYTASDMCTAPATDPKNFVDPGFLHDVLLTNLKPSTSVFYRYSSDNYTSEVYNFTTAPLKGSKKSFSFITYGDMGMSASPGAMDTVENVMKELRNGASFVLHQGDLSYAVGHAYVWEQWMNLIEPIATRVPYMVGIGNHEQVYLTGHGNDGFHPSWGNYGDDSGGECGVPVQYRFHMPNNGNGVYWYSFDYGPVHFTALSTEHNFTTGSEQYHWLLKDLASVDRSKTPWLLVVGHRPMYTSEDYPSDYKVSLHLQSDGLEDLFHRYNVDLALWGHYHSYERTCKVYKQKCTDDGVVNIVIGAAGASLDSVKQYKVEWSKHLEMNYGYGRVTVANGSALLWEYVRNVDNVVSDSVWLTK